ncbi:MAG: DUF1570 domain-containing protein [Planctomycetota bacterium]
MRTSLWLAAMLCWEGSCFTTTCCAELPRSLIDVKIGQNQFSGRVAAANEQDCWLLQRDGRLSSFHMDDVIDFSEVEPRFRPFSSIDLRDRLKTEFGRDFEAKTTAHYIVVARRGAAERYAALFEQIYRQCHLYFVARGFRMEEPEFPLVAVVFPDQGSFAKYCRSEGATPQQGLVGFYLTTSNRVALYDRVVSGQSTEEGVDDTVIHEATHQVAFNTGIHSRIGQNPQWVVEGLATLFEADGVRVRQVAADVSERINPERLEWFHKYRRQRRPAGSLESFVRDDALFKRAPLDAYSQAWALTFYLVESRPVEFARYLKAIAVRDPLTRYDADSRLNDFRDAFGRDLAIIEGGMLRFHDRLGE